jgi:hypothetical protein
MPRGIVEFIDNGRGPGVRAKGDIEMRILETRWFLTALGLFYVAVGLALLVVLWIVVSAPYWLTGIASVISTAFGLYLLSLAIFTSDEYRRQLLGRRDDEKG